MREKIYLSDDKKATLELVTMPLFEERSPWQNKKKPGLIVVPGGSYLYCSDREGYPVALEFLAKGYQTFILNYHIGDESDYPTPFEDLSKAVKYVKDNSTELGVDKENITLIGFSAGGHLVGTYGALIDNETFQKDMSMSKEQLDVKNLVLGYPAINLKPIVDVITEYEAYDKVGKLFTNYDKLKDGYEMAHKDMPRTFVFHALDDSVVPAWHTVDYVKHLVELGVDVEFYLSSIGDHGFSTGDDLSNYGREIKKRANSWVDLVVKWIDNI